MSVPALCRSLQTAGLDITLYAFKPEEKNVAVSVEIEPFRIMWQTPFPGSRQIPTMKLVRRLREDLRSFDLVHLNSLWNPAISMTAQACRHAGVPYLVSPRGMLQRSALKQRQMLKWVYYWLFERHTLIGARALHFFTEAEALDSQPLIGGSAVPLVIPNGIDPSLSKNVAAGRFRHAYPALKERTILLYLGRLHPSKGLDLQLRALPALVKRFPRVMWVLVGPDQGEWTRLWREIRSRGLESYVFWTGPLPHARCLEALADADVFLLTSRHEAHSMAMNEALSLGVPVVITETLHFQEVEDANAGYVVPWDPMSLAAAVTDILQHEDAGARMRQAGPRLVANWLAWPRVADAMIRAYQRILAAPGRDQLKGTVPCR